MKILLASDGSPHAFAAARFLSELAGREKFDVTIFTVSYDPAHPHNSAIQPWYPEWSAGEKSRVAQQQEPVQRLLSKVCEKTSLGQTFGDPVPSLLEEAKRIAADLIVVGAKGHSTIHRLLLGSTSDSIATHADCSVLVVRRKNSDPSKPQAPESTAGQETSGETIHSVMGHPPKVLFAYDGSDGAREAIAEQLELNWDLNTEVNVVAVAAQAYAFFDDSYAAMAAAYEAEHVEQIRCDAERFTAEIAKKLSNTTLQVPRANHVGDAIVMAAEQNQDDLVVIGDTGHSLLGEIFLGSTSKYVLRHAPCSVWVSRHHRRGD